jgi:hypothetical protein
MDWLRSGGVHSKVMWLFVLSRVCACVLCVSKGVCDYMCQCVYDIFFTGALVSLFLLLNTMIRSSPTYLRKNNNNNNRNKIKMKVVASNHTFHSK